MNSGFYTYRFGKRFVLSIGRVFGPEKGRFLQRVLMGLRVIYEGSAGPEDFALFRLILCLLWMVLYVFWFGFVVLARFLAGFKVGFHSG